MNLFCLQVAMILFVTCLNAQQKSETSNYFKKNYSRLNLEYFLLYEEELIECTADSIGREQFQRDINNQIKKVKSSTTQASCERKIFLNTLYNRIAATNVKGGYLSKSKSFLLTQLSEFRRLDFKVDFKLMEEQLNPKKRGMPFGDEECDVNYSLYIFFIYDPSLYMKVITESKIANPSSRIIFPTKCFLEELSHFPINIKKNTQARILKMIDGYKGENFESLRSVIRNANLNAHYH